MKEFHYFWCVFCKLDMTWETKVLSVIHSFSSDICVMNGDCELMEQCSRYKAGRTSTHSTRSQFFEEVQCTFSFEAVALFRKL